MDKDKVVEENAKLIYDIAKNFYGVPKEDLFQAGVVGLLKASKNYKQNENVKFSTYAYQYIFGEMYLLSSKKLIKVSSDTLKIYKLVEKTRYQQAQKLGYIPSNNEIANILNLELSIVDYACISASDILSSDHSAENERPLYETISAKENITVDDQILLYTGLEMLPEDEKKVLSYRYFNDETQSEVARKLKMTQVKVSRLEKKGINKMRDYIQSSV